MHWEVCVTAILLVFCGNGLAKPSMLIANKVDEKDPFTSTFDRIRRMMEGAMFEMDKNDTTSTGSGEGFQHIETRKVQILPDGSKKITTFVQKHDYDKDLKNFTNNQKETEIIKHANHSISLVVREGENNDDMEETQNSQVGCTDNSDCELSAYCHKSSYQCKACHTKRQSCKANHECCPGLSCDKTAKICLKPSGQIGDFCEVKSDCEKDMCCALNDNGDGSCQPYLKEGSDCGRDSFHPFFPFGMPFGNSMLEEATSGLPNRCPCKPGLKCLKRRASLFFPSQQLCTAPKPKGKPKKLLLHKTHFTIHPLLSLFGIPLKKSHNTHSKKKPHKKHIVHMFLKPRDDILKEEHEIEELADHEDMPEHKGLPDHGNMPDHLEMPDHQDEEEDEGWYDFDGHHNSVKKRSAHPLFKAFDPFKSFNSPFPVISEDDDEVRDVRHTRDLSDVDEERGDGFMHGPFDIFGGLMSSLNKILGKF